MTRATVAERRSTTATALSSPSGTRAIPFRALTPTGVGVVPPSGTEITCPVFSTGTMLRVLAVLFTTRSTSVGSGSGALVSAQPSASRAAMVVASKRSRIMVPPS